MMDPQVAPLGLGLFFLVFGLANLIDATTSVDIEPRTAWPLALVLMGIAGVVAALRRYRSSNEEPHDPASPGAVDG